MNNKDNTIVIGVGEYGASKDPKDSIKTYGLGSCVAVVLMDPKERIVGMVHVALPESNINKDKAKKHPGYFADTAIEALIKDMERLGYNKKKSKLIVKMAGGANVMDPKSLFSIGNRNVLAVKKALWKYGLGPLSEDVGGSWSRTVAVSLGTGKVLLTSPGRKDKFL